MASIRQCAMSKQTPLQPQTNKTASQRCSCDKAVTASRRHQCLPGGSEQLAVKLLQRLRCLARGLDRAWLPCTHQRQLLGSSPHQPIQGWVVWGATHQSPPNHPLPGVNSVGRILTVLLQPRTQIQLQRKGTKHLLGREGPNWR